MAKKDIDWANIGFGYIQTEKRYVTNFKNGEWDKGGLIEDPNIVLSECAGVLQYAQTAFEGLKAYTTVDGRIVTFRPDLNAERMMDSAKRLEMLLLVLSLQLNISSEFSQLLLVHTSRKVQNQLQLRSAILIELLHTEQVILRLVLTMQ